MKFNGNDMKLGDLLPRFLFGHEQMRVYNLIRDLTADAYGGWELVTTIAAGGGLAAQRIVTMGGYDLEGAKDQARLAAGITN